MHEMGRRLHDAAVQQVSGARRQVFEGGDVL